MRTLLLVTLLVWVAAPRPGAAATIHVETLDAGALVGTAQVTVGGSPLDGIQGRLSQPAAGGEVTDLFDIDLYQIFVFDPGGFSASTTGGPFNVSDPQLFLFDAVGRGVFMNDDDPGNPPQSALGSLPGGLLAGFYFLAIGFFDNDALDALAALMFDPVTGLPVNPLATLAAWSNQVTGPNTDVPFEYEIALSGTRQAAPEPATLTLLAGGLAGALARKRFARRR